MAAVGLKTHIWGNNLRSALLLAEFPVLLVVMLFAAQVLLMGFGVLDSTGDTGRDLANAVGMLPMTVPMALVGSAIWFAIAYAGHQVIIDAATGARAVDRKDEPALYNLLENLCISRGLKTPSLRIIDTDQLNAFASGLHEGRYAVTVTRGLIDTLDRDELEAVLAHELTHIINKDVRTMVIAAIFAGVISVTAELVFRGLTRVRGGGRKGNAGALILMGLAFAAVGWVLSLLIRMAISRSREFVADAGAVELTKNPDAMISALRKIEGRAALEAPDTIKGLFLENERSSPVDLLATHPPIEKRVAALVKFAGGRDPGPWSPTEDADASEAETAVPETA